MTVPASPRRTVIGLTLVVAALLTACGGGDDGGDATAEYAQALSESMRNNAQGEMTEGESNCLAQRIVEMIGVEQLESQGVAVEDITAADSMSELELELPDDARAQVGGAMVDCFEDLAGVFGETFVPAAGEGSECLVEGVDEEILADIAAAGIIEGETAENTQAAAVVLIENAPGSCAEELIVNSLVADGSIEEESAGCVRDTMDDEIARALMLAGVTGEEANPDDLARGQAAILSCAASGG